MKKAFNYIKDCIKKTIKEPYPFLVLLVAAFSAYFMYKQNIISEQLIQMQQLENQPHFTVDTELSKTQNIDLYDTKTLKISSTNNSASNIKTSVRTYYELSYVSPKSKEKTVYIWVSDYFDVSATNNYYSFNNNHLHYSNFCKSCVNERIDGWYFFPDVKHCVQISYTDKYQKDQKKYFISREEVSIEKYNEVGNKALSRNGSQLPFSLQKVNLTDIIDQYILPEYNCEQEQI